MYFDALAGAKAAIQGREPTFVDMVSPLPWHQDTPLLVWHVRGGGTCRALLIPTHFMEDFAHYATG